MTDDKILVQKLAIYTKYPRLALLIYTLQCIFCLNTVVVLLKILENPEVAESMALSHLEE